MDKVDALLQGIIKFVKEFFFTYWSCIRYPMKFFNAAVLTDEKPANNLSSVPYMLISSFFLIYTINVQPLSKYLFALLPPGLNDLMGTFLNADPKQVLITALPVSAFLYISTKLVAKLSGLDHFNRVLMYWAGTCFLTYFFSYMILVLYSGMLAFLSSQDFDINRDKGSLTADIIWYIIFAFWGYVLLAPMNGIRTVMKKRVRPTGKKIIVYFGIIFTVIACAYIGIKQKEFDPVFNPLKLYRVKYSFLRVSGDTLITISLKDSGMQGGASGENGRSRPSTASDSTFESTFPRKILMDAVIENSSPELIILRPNSCLKLVAFSQEEIDKKMQPNNGFILDMLCEDMTVVAHGEIQSTDLRERMLLYPAESQWLHLTAPVDMHVWDKINNMYYNDSLSNDKYKKIPSYFLEIYNVNSKQNPELVLRSDFKRLMIRNFVPDRQRYDSLKRAGNK